MWKGLFYVVLLPILFFLILALILSIIPTSPKNIQCNNPQSIYLSTNGIHVDIILPITKVDSLIVQSLPTNPKVQFIAFGWGDRGFYLETPTWDDLKWSTALRALFWKSPTIMHVSPYYRPYPKWEKLSICKEQLENLNQFIIASFKKDKADKLILIPDAGYGQLDKFYEAKGNYSAIRTCNNWANEALKKAEIKTAQWTPFDFGILYHVD